MGRNGSIKPGGGGGGSNSEGGQFSETHPHAVVALPRNTPDMAITSNRSVVNGGAAVPAVDQITSLLEFVADRDAKTIQKACDGMVSIFSLAQQIAACLITNDMT
jgi:hypothetical protein